MSVPKKIRYHGTLYVLADTSEMTQEPTPSTDGVEGPKVDKKQKVKAPKSRPASASEE